MIDLDSFRDWVHKTLDNKVQTKIDELKQPTTKAMFAEKSCKKPNRKYLVTEADHLDYKVDKKPSNH